MDNFTTQCHKAVREIDLTLRLSKAAIRPVDTLKEIRERLNEIEQEMEDLRNERDDLQLLEDRLEEGQSIRKLSAEKDRIERFLSSQGVTP